MSDRFLKGSLEMMMRQVAIIPAAAILPATSLPLLLLLRYHCGSAYNWKPQEGAVNTNIYDNGDVFCESVNPELLISLLTKNPCHIDNTFSLFFSSCFGLHVELTTPTGRALETITYTSYASVWLDNAKKLYPSGLPITVS